MPLFLSVAAVSWILASILLLASYILMFKTIWRVVKGGKISGQVPASLGPVSLRTVRVWTGMVLLFHFSWMFSGVFWICGIPHGDDAKPCDAELYDFGRNLGIVWGVVFFAHSLYTYLTKRFH